MVRSDENIFSDKTYETVTRPCTHHRGSWGITKTKRADVKLDMAHYIIIIIVITILLCVCAHTYTHIHIHLCKQRFYPATLLFDAGPKIISVRSQMKRKHSPQKHEIENKLGDTGFKSETL